MCNKKKILIFSLFLICNLGFSQWEQSIGSEGLDVQAVLSTNEFDYFGGQTGTYRSEDKSYSFTFSNSGNDSIGPTRGFTTDDFYLYTCTSQGVFRSSDKGGNWVSKSTGLTQLLSHGMTRSKETIFLATLSGIFKSNNQGDSWETAGMSGLDSRSITCLQDSILFVGTQGSGVFKSIDNGANWVAVNNGLTSQNFRAIQAKGNTVFAGGQNGTGVYRSTDFGMNWTLLTNGIATSSYRGFASNEDLIIAGSTVQGVYYSTDNGEHWIQINNGLGDLNVFDLEINSKYIIAGTHSDGVYRFPLSELPVSSVAISEVEKKSSKLNRILDIMGRNSSEKPNTPLLYLYDNGTVVKKIILN